MSDSDLPKNDDPSSPLFESYDDEAAAQSLGEEISQVARGEKTVDEMEDNVAAFEVLKKLQDELAESKDQALRLAADLENTRKRAEREKQDAAKYAIANFARDLLGVSDNFARALTAVGDEDDASPETLKVVVQGLKMTEKELLNMMERHGVKQIAAKGEKFDPNLHQAVAQIPSAEVPSGHVLDVAQHGFTIGGRVLRAAMVTVSSGGGSAPAPEAPGIPDTPSSTVDTKA